MKLAITAAITVLLFAFTAFGQSSSGVTGTVTDPSGAIVPGATVVLHDTKTNKEQTTVTNDDGSYKFNQVEPGAGYRITVSRQGFQTYVLNEVQISVGRTDTQNIQLTAGEVSAKVEVVATTGDATLNTTDPSVGNVIGSRQLQELPIQLRGSPAALIGLQPGVIGNNVGTTTTNRVGSVTGSRADQGNITVDGIDANDQTTGQAFNTVANAPIDSIQEFRGTVAGIGASDGRSSGGQIQLKTNSGTNDFHGNIREYYRNENTAANTFFGNRAGTNAITGAKVQPRPKLRRHQYGFSFGGPIALPSFGENDGPKVHLLKDKAFFFLDNERRRDRSQTSTSRTVPLPSWRAGNIGYIRATNSQTGATCPTNPRQNDPATAGCIGFATPADIQAFDPQHIGINQALLNLYNSRFPLPNDLSLGNGINTGGFRWNAPSVRDDNIYTLRFDVIPTDRQRVFARFTRTRRASTNSIQFLPGDEDAVSFQDKSFAFAAGHTWIITSNLTNVITAGVTKQQNFFSVPTQNTSFPYSFSGGTIGAFIPSLSYQDRKVTVPTYRDDVTWTHGNHTFLTGISYKPIRQLSTLRNDFTFVTLGIGGTGITTNFGTSAAAATLRPANIANNTTARNSYDNALSTMLGRIATTSTNYNYDAAGNALPPGSGKIRNYAYNEYEGYVQDNWRIRSDLTLNLGVRYSMYPAPYELAGAMASDTTDWTALLATRLSNAAAGIAGDTAEPFLVYNLAGKNNPNAPDLYKTDKNNWGPRLGFAYSPSFKDGVLGKLFGDRKTSLRGGYGITYDRVTGAILFIQSQLDFIFQNSGSRQFGNTNPVTALANDPRFTSFNTIPASAATVAPAATRPLTPFVTGGIPNGIATGQFNYTIDHNFKTPYSHLWDFSIQRELPGNHLLDVSYVGRMGRALFVQSDAAQVLDFKDPGSGQFLFGAFNNLQAQLQGGASLATVTSIPWFENQVQLGINRFYAPGTTCTSFGIAGVTNCTQLVASQSAGSLIQVGDASDAIQSLRASGLLRNNVGLSAQFASNAYISNQGESDYHGLLVSLQKRFSHGFEYELNYTFSHAIDNQSTITNTVQGAIICDAVNPDRCRSNADFDIRHLFNANFILDLPVGRNRWLGHNMNRWVNGIIGGWTVSGILQMRSGLPFSPSPSQATFPTSFIYSSPAIVTDPTAFTQQIHDVTSNNTIQFFADPARANAALRDPRNGEIGSRNVLRGPMFWTLDMGIAKKFGVPWSERQRITFRADAFNLTNSNLFALPGVTRQNLVGTQPLSSAFGQITGSASSAREIQFALRWDF